MSDHKYQYSLSLASEGLYLVSEDNTATDYARDRFGRWWHRNENTDWDWTRLVGSTDIRWCNQLLAAILSEATEIATKLARD